MLQNLIKYQSKIIKLKKKLCKKLCKLKKKKNIIIVVIVVIKVLVICSIIWLGNGEIKKKKIKSILKYWNFVKNIGNISQETDKKNRKVKMSKY